MTESKLVRCDACRGTKKVIGIGGLQKDCPNCKGIGWAEEKDKDLKEDEKPSPSPIEIKETDIIKIKKRGRPKNRI